MTAKMATLAGMAIAGVKGVKFVGWGRHQAGGWKRNEGRRPALWVYWAL